MRSSSLVHCALAVILALASTAHAAPSAPPAPVANKRLTLKRLGAKRAEKIQKGGEELTRGQVLDMFEADAPVPVAGGKRITVQELVDSIEQAEADLAAKGSSLAKLPRKAWMKPATATKIAAQKSALAGELTLHRPLGAPKAPKAPPRSGAACTPSTCVPADTEQSVRWEKQKGDEDVVAAYTSVSVAEKTPDAYGMSCSATWDNGVYLLGEKRSLVRFVADASSKTGRGPSSSAKAALYVMGQSSPVWSKGGTVESADLDRTFATPRVGMSYAVVPGLTFSGGVYSAATLSLRPTIEASAGSGAAACGVGVKPRLVAGVRADVKLTVGIPKLAELAEGSLTAKLDAVDVRVPSDLKVSLTQAPLALDLRFESEVKATFLKGTLVARYELKDICIAKKCLIEDGLGIPTSGEIELYDSDGLEYGATLADLRGPIGFEPASGVVEPMR
jgi:hypothetical protein